MTFSSLIFIFGFLPIVLVIYYVLPNVLFKNILLVLASFLFYAWDNPTYLILLILSVLWNYIAAINLANESDSKKKKYIFIGSIAVNIFILCFFKYTNFLIDIINILPLHLEHMEIGLPIGLSFYTFSAISYIADVYTGKVEVEKNILCVALYIAFFGKVTMGPIVQYHQMNDQLSQRPLMGDDLKEGVFLFLKGLFKKVLLADRLAMVFQAMQTNTTVIGTWLYAISYMLQLYFDFSGYSDMAIGLSRMFGFHFAENFNHPYAALSIQDFWRRWHISLSRWFRDYIYIPLGGNRVSTKKYCRNIFVVWFLTGLWHGANWTFIVWGLYYGCLLLLERFVLKKHLEHMPKILCHVYTLILVLVGWIFFMSPSIGQAFKTIFAMVGVGTNGIINSQVLFYLRGYGIVILLGCFFSGNNYKYVQRANFYLFKDNANWMTTTVYILLFLMSISYIISSTFQSFLYFAF